MWGNRTSNYVCRKHKYSSKSKWGGRCPICREELECIGDKKRIGHCGQFDKIERKTRKFAGQKPIITQSARTRAFRKRIEEFKKKQQALAVSTDTSFVKMS